MATKVMMPQLGESVVEGTVSRWLKAEGETIAEYEPLLEVSTDKVDTEVPSPAGGVVLKIYVSEGQTVARGTLLAEIGQPGEAPAADAEPLPELAGLEAVRSQPAANGGASASFVTPVVARMAAEHQLDLSAIQGSGRGGRVTKKDVEAYLERQKNTPAVLPQADDLPPWEQPGAGDLFRPTVEYAAETPPTPAQPVSPAQLSAAAPAGAPGELLPLTPMRRAVAEHMVRSKLHTAPHVTTLFEVDMSAVLAHQAAHSGEFNRLGLKLTLTAYFAAAAVAALRDNPMLNAEWRGDGIFLHHAVHLGIAVALDDGLIVPVIRNAQDLNLMGTARAVNDLTARARARKLRPDEVSGGTFTLTNHGVSGSLLATPIINQPQAAILGVGLVEKRVKVIGDALAIRPCCYVTLTFDHRIADGAVGDRWMQTFKTALENWG